MSFQARNYQQDCMAGVHNEFEQVTATAIVLPTGCGKTCVFAMIIKDRLPRRALVLAHREELIWQARSKIEDIANVECGIEMADLYSNNSLFGNQPVIISTVQTQNSAWGDRKRMGRFKPTDFDTLIIDECHHATSPSYKAVINYYRQNPNLKVLGVTATPDRADEEALGQVFDTVAFDYEILDAINDGWLVPITQQFVSVAGLDFSDVKTTAGDLNGADLAAVMESEKNMQGVTGAAIEIIGNKRAILFTCSVKQAEQASEIFNRYKPGMADWVCGKTNKDDRRSKLERFKTGSIQVMCNCGVLTEGYDDAGVEVILMGRPTKSRSLYAQMAGRGTRPLPGVVDGLEDGPARLAAIGASAKPSCNLVDFVGNSGRHKLMSSADILGGKVSEEAIRMAVARAKCKGTAVRMDIALSEEEKEIHRKSEEARKMAEARKHRLVAKVRYSSKTISPFDVFDIQPVKQRGWDSQKVLSEKQSAFLMKRGVNPDKYSYAENRQLIGEMFRRYDQKLCTMKQAQLLQRYGYSTKDMKFEAASKLITSLKDKGWKRDGIAPKPIVAPSPKADVSEPYYDEPSPF